MRIRMNVKKRLLSFMITSCLVVGLIPNVAFAAEPQGPITVEKATYDNKNCEFWFSINETAEDDVTVDIGNEIAALLSEKVGYIMPAHQFNITVHIKNNSPNAFVYDKQGMNLGTKKVSEDEALFLTNFKGYDGNRIDLPRIASIDYNHPATRELFGQKIGRNDYKQVLNIYQLLADKGFTGESAISDYFLDYYQKKYSLRCLKRN